MTLATMRARLLASSMITGAALAAATGAFAQATTTGPAGGPASPPAGSTAAPGGGTGTTVGEFVVTGSRIPQPNLTSISPVTSVASQELKLSGTTRVEDLLNSLPQITADQGSNVSNGASGTATVALRNLGPSRTLVLIDGRRVNAGDPISPFPDLNFIPEALVSRVEVDTAGASAVYGSDAVAGVVNFIMKRDFEGVQVDVNYGGYQHDNNNQVAQEANARKFATTHNPSYLAPHGGTYDGQTVDATVIIGVNSPDGKGNVEGYLTYRHIDAVRQDKRDYSNCTLAVQTTGPTKGRKYNCSGSGTIPDGQFIILNSTFNTVHDSTLDRANPGTFRDRTAADVFNFAPYNYFQRPDETYTGGFFAHYDINKHVQAYSEFMFMDDHTVAQIAPSGIFGTTFNIRCNNPLLSAQEAKQICTDVGIPITPTSSNPNVIILKRNVEGGPRRDDLRHTDYRAVIGLKGAIDDNWSYDIYGSYSASVYSENYQNDVSKRKVANALDVQTDTRALVNGQPNPTFNTPQCVSFINGTEPDCVPYNIFTPDAVTKAAIGYVGAPGFKSGQNTLQVVEGTVTGNLGQYGGKSPWAHDGIGISLGADYQRDAIVLSPDIEFLTGDLAGQGAKQPATDGAYDVKEIFGEARVPIVQDMPYAKDVELELGYRFSNYSTVGNTTAYKIQGDWAINDDVRIRGGFNRAVRAPNVDELFVPGHLALDGNTDNCSGANPVFTLAQCENTGVTPNKYGSIAANPANQYNGIVGGNPQLKAEVAKTYSVGVVITPTSLIKGMSFSADYFNITVDNVIQSIGADNILNNCATTGNPFTCHLVTRAPGTQSLWLGTNGFITDITQNLGSLKTSGVDFAFNYQTRFQDFGLPNYGGLSLAFIGTYTATYTVQGLAGVAPLNCVSKFGTICQGTATPQTGPLPAFKSKTRLTWTTPWPGLEFSLNWRYIGPSDLDVGPNLILAHGVNSGIPLVDNHINAYNYFDLATQYRFKDRYTLRVGVNNLFDKDPPIIGSAQLPNIVGNGNTFAQVYDSLGRYLFMGVTADF